MMKTIEQQKVELLDWLIDQCNKRPNAFNEAKYFLVEASKKYLEITQQKPLSQDPYIDEIFSPRLVKIIYSTYQLKPESLRLSECPSIRTLDKCRGFGPASRKEYTEVMKDYKMTGNL